MTAFAHVFGTSCKEKKGPTFGARTKITSIHIFIALSKNVSNHRDQAGMGPHPHNCPSLLSFYIFSWPHLASPKCCNYPVWLYIEVPDFLHPQYHTSDERHCFFGSGICFLLASVSKRFNWSKLFQLALLSQFEYFIVVHISSIMFQIAAERVRCGTVLAYTSRRTMLY